MEIPSIFLNRVLLNSAKKNAANAYFSVGSIPLMRINNVLVPMEKEDILTSEMAEKIVDSFLTPEEKKELRDKKEIKVIKVFAGNYRFRVNIFFQKGFYSISFKFITGIIRDFLELGLPVFLNSVAGAEAGLFIIAGPQSSGKSTTLASLVEVINRSSNKRIVVIEEKIETFFVSKKSLIEQREIGKDALDYGQALDNCLEDGVDVVALGEIRKEKFFNTIPKIIDLASGNSLVILELNASGAIRVIEEILDNLSKDSSQESACHALADVFLGVIAQRLLPKVGGGLVLANELLIGNNPVRSFIRDNKTAQIDNIIQTSRKEGMVSFDKAIDELSKAGLYRIENKIITA